MGKFSLFPWPVLAISNLANHIIILVGKHDKKDYSRNTLLKTANQLNVACQGVCQGQLKAKMFEIEQNSGQKRELINHSSSWRENRYQPLLNPQTNGHVQMEALTYSDFSSCAVSIDLLGDVCQKSLFSLSIWVKRKFRLTSWALQGKHECITHIRQQN